MEVYVNNCGKVPVKQVLYQVIENTLDVDCNEDVRATEYIFTTKEKAEEPKPRKLNSSANSNNQLNNNNL